MGSGWRPAPWITHGSSAARQGVFRRMLSPRHASAPSRFCRLPTIPTVLPEGAEVLDNNMHRPHLVKGRKKTRGSQLNVFEISCKVSWRARRPLAAPAPESDEQLVLFISSVSAP